MRGEYAGDPAHALYAMELPPHARRIRGIEQEKRFSGGTTSACAENTPGSVGREACPGNYLRMRGEYCNSELTQASLPELPPHARRILLPIDLGGVKNGTTSACAENTVILGVLDQGDRNYSWHKSKSG